MLWAEEEIFDAEPASLCDLSRTEFSQAQAAQGRSKAGWASASFTLTV